MRWSRQHDDSSLGELMESSDEDTQVRLYPGDHTGEPTTPPPADTDAGTDDSFLDDEDYLPQEHRGPGRLTVALVAALVLAVGVLGGVWVQKQLGTSTSSAAGARGQYAGGTGGPGFPGAAGGQGAPGGSASGAAGAPGGGASGAAGGGAQPGTASGSAGGSAGGAGIGSGTGTSTTPAVVGTVTSTAAKSLVVTDLGGTRHTVTVTSSTTLTTPYGHALKAGDTVAVTGTAGSGGAVSATGLTVS